MKRLIGNIIFVIYAAIAIFVTICLLSYNDYKISEFGNNSWIIIDNNSLEPNFNSGDLAIVNSKDKIEKGTNIFFYMIYDDEVEVTYGQVTEVIPVSIRETNYVINDEVTISGNYVIGSADNAQIIPSVGTILSILESKWGFLFLIVFPSLIAFVYELYIIIMEVKDAKDKQNIQKAKA